MQTSHLQFDPVPVQLALIPLGLDQELVQCALIVVVKEQSIDCSDRFLVTRNQARHVLAKVLHLLLGLKDQREVG